MTKNMFLRPLIGVMECIMSVGVASGTTYTKKESLAYQNTRLSC
jgi:hypothetical protein